MSIITDHDRLRVLKVLAAGKSVKYAAELTGLPLDAVVRINSANGGPNIERLSWAADTMESSLAAADAFPPVDPDGPPAAEGVTELELDTLVSRAGASFNAATRRKGQRLHDLAAELRDTVKAEHAEQERRERETHAREQALADVESLKKKLAEAQAKLGKKPAAAKPSSSGTTADLVAARFGVTRDDIRTWARGNGHHVGDRGRIAGAVLDAYVAARS